MKCTCCLKDSEKLRSWWNKEKKIASWICSECWDEKNYQEKLKEYEKMWGNKVILCKYIILIN